MEVISFDIVHQKIRVAHHAQHARVERERIGGRLPLGSLMQGEKARGSGARVSVSKKMPN